MKINLNQLIKKIQNNELSRSQIHNLRIKEENVLSTNLLGPEANKFTNRVYIELSWEMDMDNFMKIEEQEELFIRLTNQITYFLLQIFQYDINAKVNMCSNYEQKNLHIAFCTENLLLDKKYIEKVTKILNGTNILAKIDENLEYNEMTSIISKPEMEDQLNFVQKYNLKHRKSFQKILNFIGNKFYSDTDYEPSISDYHIFESYQRAKDSYLFKSTLAAIACKHQNIDFASKTFRELIDIYLTDPQLIKCSNRLESNIKDIYFKYKLICKEFNPESLFSWLPKEVIHNIISHLGPYSLCNESYDEQEVIGDL